MATRRQEKVARVIKETVSDCIANHLSDPRIEGLVSITKVDVSPDLRNADIYLSILGTNEAAQNKTFNAIIHASKRIQGFVAHDVNSKFCPVIHFKNDDNFKKTLETMKLIDMAMNETISRHSEDDTENQHESVDKDDFDENNKFEENI